MRLLKELIQHQIISLFSAQNPYGKGKIFISNKLFLLQNMPRSKFIFKVKIVTHRIQLTEN